MTELSFCAGFALCPCIAPKGVFIEPYGKKPIIWCPFYGFKSKYLFKINLMHWNADTISHVPILRWSGMMSSFPSPGSAIDITQHFSLNSFLALSFDINMFHLTRVWKILTANQYYGNLLPISINLTSRSTVLLKTFPWIFSHPNFIKNTFTYDVSEGCKC